MLRPARGAPPSLIPPRGRRRARAAPVQMVPGRPTVLDLGPPITRVSLTNADIADAMVTSATQLLLHGKAPGTISMFVWEKAGGVRRYDISVGRDVARMSDQVKE